MGEILRRQLKDSPQCLLKNSMNIENTTKKSTESQRFSDQKLGHPSQNMNPLQHITYITLLTVTTII